MDNKESILQHNVLNFLKYDFKNALPYLTYDFINDTSLFFLEDSYFGFTLFPEGFVIDDKMKKGIIQNTYLKRSGKIMNFLSFIPNKTSIHMESIADFIKQVLIPGNVSDVKRLQTYMNEVIERLVPFFKSGNDVMISDLFDFYRILGCNIKNYNAEMFIRDHIDISLTVDIVKESPVFSLNNYPIYIYTAKSDTNKIFHDFTFLGNKVFSDCDFMINHTVSYKKKVNRELCSFVFFGHLDNNVLDFFYENGVFLQKKDWESVIVLINSFPLSITYHEFFKYASSLIERHIQ